MGFLRSDKNLGLFYYDLAICFRRQAEGVSGLSSGKTE
jgi:hypothetical protein